MQKLTRKILILDPDANALPPLKEYLERQGFECRTGTSVRDGLTLLADESFDAVISELRFDDGRVTDLLTDGYPPVMVFSASRDEDEIVGALSLGCSDYVFKPCSPRVMAARLGARFSVKANAFEYYGLLLDLSLRQVTYRGEPVKLTSCEFDILGFLMAHPGEFFSGDEIYKNVWHTASMQTSVVRFHLANLKRAILAATGKNLIIQKFGAGYAFASED